MWPNNMVELELELWFRKVKIESVFIRFLCTEDCSC
jgi:hypothetical protein